MINTENAPIYLHQFLVQIAHFVLKFSGLAVNKSKFGNIIRKLVCPRVIITQFGCDENKS